MSKLITPPTSRSGSEASQIETKPAPTLQTSPELRLQLDILLEQYLDLLHKQQQLQSGLAKHMSLGYLSLAQANYSSPPGRRYGADYYDERMKATQKISICMGSKTEGGSRVLDDHADDMIGDPPDENLGDMDYRFTLEHISRHMSDQQPVETQVELPEAKGLNTHASRSEIYARSNETDSGASQGAPDNQELPLEGTPERLQKPRSDDPLHWYGVLVPFALRTTQKAFAEGIRNQIPGLATVIVEMRALEHRIGRLRTQLAGAVDAQGEP